DGRRGRPALAVRLDVDSGLEQPLEPEDVRRRPVAVQAAGVGRLPQVGAWLLAAARLARRLLSVPVRNGRARSVALPDRRAAGEGGTLVLPRQPRAPDRPADRA